MRFYVLDKRRELLSFDNGAFLVRDRWDDWGKFATMYSLYYKDEEGGEHSIGQVKIGQFGMVEGQRSAELPESFDELGEHFFSLGQDDSYYLNLNKLGGPLRDEILHSLSDVAKNVGLFEVALNEPVMGNSLLRSVSPSSVRGQFHRIATGGIRLTKYSFSYEITAPKEFGASNVEIKFAVKPHTKPPTNLHVLIGRNGVGKTRCLGNMARSIVDDDIQSEIGGRFKWNEPGAREVEDQQFTSVVSVTFSAFDEFQPLGGGESSSVGVSHSYIGLHRPAGTDGAKYFVLKSLVELFEELKASLNVVLSQDTMFTRLRNALKVLCSDPIFRDSEVLEILNSEVEQTESLWEEVKAAFRRLSSGHKIVLLTITRLVEIVGEKSLVLLDEPEAHLHPPLLSAFIRALSELLIDRNGVAVIATHSPVVLQEVPRECVWKIRRSGEVVSAERPKIETFAESVGVLTHEIFGLEVTESGFHKMIQEEVDRHNDYESVLDAFDEKLGFEGRALARALINTKRKGDVNDVEN